MRKGLKTHAHRYNLIKLFHFGLFCALSVFISMMRREINGLTGDFQCFTNNFCYLILSVEKRESK